MTEKERSTIIAQLAFTENVNESVYENHSDEELLERLEFLFGDREGSQADFV